MEAERAASLKARRAIARERPQPKPGRGACVGTTGCSKAEAEEGVRLAYRAAGLSPPQIVWRRDPVELAHAWASAAFDVGVNVGHSLIEQPCREGLRRVGSPGCDRAGVVRTLFGGERSRAISTAVQAAVIDETGKLRPPLVAWMKRPRRPGSARLARRPAFAHCGYGPRNLCAASLAAGIGEPLDGDAGTALRGLRLIADNAGWLVPYEGTCWLSLAPDVVSADGWGRLHCGTGPALRYPEGWALYAWKGTPVPAWIVMQPDRITLQWIDAQIDPRIRHAMIDILTPLQFIAAGGAERAASDTSGTLWKRTWTHRGTVIDAWAAVEAVETARQERMLRCVPADIETPREALAWLRGRDGPRATPLQTRNWRQPSDGLRMLER
jgi:hypothetical protein